MTPLRCIALALAAFLSCAAAQAEVTVAGVRYDDKADIRGVPVQLNGAGIRYKGPFKVYAAGMYLARKAATPEEVLAANGAKRLSVTMLRDIDSAELGKLFIRGVEDNMDRSAFAKLIPGLMRMSQMFTDFKKLSAGDTFMIDWVPGTGTIVTVKGMVQGEPFREPEFYNALLRIWLGPAPADWKLKESLLGKAA